MGHFRRLSDVGNFKGKETAMRSYYQFIEITDFGPYVTKLILAFPDLVKAGEICTDQFCVYTRILDREGNQIKMPENFIRRDKFVPAEGYRVIGDAYPSDAAGNRAAEGRFVTLEMKYGPLYPCSSALAADFTNINGHESYVDSVNVITQTKEIKTAQGTVRGLVFDHCARVMNPAVDRWLEDVSGDAEMPLRYGYFVPQRGMDKRPLIVWLHGAGEGGTDTAISYSGNKATALTDDAIQSRFDGCYVFSPQCPTMWLDDGSGQYGTSGRSIYTRALKAGIGEFIARNSYGIDPDRVYIGGDSNGGFMTMRMIADYPDFFAAAFPICEALYDASITDEEIGRLARTPIWFTHSKDDPVVDPEKYAVATYRRLLAAGAENVHFTYWDGIYDMHGQFQDAEGKPFHYMGHFAWIPVFNEDCRTDFDGRPVVVDGRETGLFEWLAMQRRVSQG